MNDLASQRIGSKRPMAMSRTKLNFALDSVAGLLFILSLFAGDGALFHVVVTVLFTAAVAIHLYLHWGWIENICRRLVSDRSPRASKRTIQNFAVDMFLLLTFAITFVSGIALVAAPGGTAASGVHAFSSALFILGMIVHLALHWAWIVGCIRRARHGRPKPAGGIPRKGAAAADRAGAGP